MKNIFKLLILCLLCVCFNAHAQVPGTPYIFAFDDKATIPGHAPCTNATISRTSCSKIPGTRMNDSAGSTIAIEYDWASAVTYTAARDSFRALVEINGQCWYKYDADVIPSAYGSRPSWIGSNTLNGWNGYYTGGPYAGEGRLYDRYAAMNTTAQVERQQGICAPGFHIPSDCEFKYMLYKFQPSTWLSTPTSTSIQVLNNFVGSWSGWGRGNNGTWAMRGGIYFNYPPVGLVLDLRFMSSTPAGVGSLYKCLLVQGTDFSWLTPDAYNVLEYANANADAIQVRCLAN